MGQSRILLGIDIGSTRISTVVGEIRNSRGLALKSLSTVPTTAITRGVVRDLNQAAQDIDDSFSRALYSSGLSVNNVFVGLTGRELYSENRRAAIEVADRDGEVTAEDVDRVIDLARPQSLPEGMQVVHTMVREYALDGIRTTRSPIGMIGNQLEVETHVVHGSSSHISNIERALSRVDLKVRSYVYNLIAAGEAVLSGEDRNSGCVLIDFGGGTTNVGIFIGGTLCYSKCIPIGGMNYDQDLKHGLGISYEEALRIKKSYGKAWLDKEGEELDDFIDIKFFGRREYDKIKRSRVYEIMQPRTEELVEQIIVALNESEQMSRIPGGVIIVGGGSQLRQLRRYLQKHLQRQVRVGVPTGVAHLLDEYRTPAYATPLGLLLYGAKFEETAPAAEPSFVSEVLDSLKDLVGGLLKPRKDKDKDEEG